MAKYLSLIYVCDSCQSQFCYLCMVQNGGIISSEILLTKHFPSFDDCLDENKMDPRYLKQTVGIMPKHCNIWCFIGEIIENISFFTPAIIVRDITNQKVHIQFYFDNSSGNERNILPKLQVGSLICIRYALKHHFFDLSVGIKIDDSDMDYITLIPNVSMKKLIDIDSTGCLMEYYQNDVLRKPNKIKLNYKCWSPRCNSTFILLRCTGCSMALYCGVTHQMMDCEHQRICKKIKQIKSLCAVELDIYSDEKEFVDFKVNKKKLLHEGLRNYFKTHIIYDASAVEALFYIRYNNHFKDKSERSIFQSMYDRYHQRYIDTEIIPTVDRYIDLLQVICEKLMLSRIKYDRSEMYFNFRNTGIKQMFRDLMTSAFDYNEIYPHRLCLIECWKLAYRFGKNVISKYDAKSMKRYIVKQVLDENYKTIHDDISDGFLWWQCDRLQGKLFGRKCAGYECVEIEKKYNEGKYKMCKGCQIVYYCSRKCQKRDWIKRHKLKCQSCKKIYDFYRKFF
eukprot:437376_1